MPSLQQSTASTNRCRKKSEHVSLFSRNKLASHSYNKMKSSCFAIVHRKSSSVFNLEYSPNLAEAVLRGCRYAVESETFIAVHQWSASCSSFALMTDQALDGSRCFSHASLLPFSSPKSFPQEPRLQENSFCNKKCTVSPDLYLNI